MVIVYLIAAVTYALMIYNGYLLWVNGRTFDMQRGIFSLVFVLVTSRIVYGLVILGLVAYGNDEWMIYLFIIALFVVLNEVGFNYRRLNLIRSKRN